MAKRKLKANTSDEVTLVKQHHDGRNRIVTWHTGASGHKIECKDLGNCEEGLDEKEAERVYNEYIASTQAQ